MTNSKKYSRVYRAQALSLLFAIEVAFESTVGIGIIALGSAQFHSDRPLRALLCAYSVDHDLVKDERP